MLVELVIDGINLPKQMEKLGARAQGSSICAREIILPSLQNSQKEVKKRRWVEVTCGCNCKKLREF